jgi:hypothetical protein
VLVYSNLFAINCNEFYFLRMSRLGRIFNEVTESTQQTQRILVGGVRTLL